MIFRRLHRLILSLVPRKAKVRVLSGPLRGFRWIAGASTNGCWAGTYERDTQRLFCSTINRGDVVCDVGANVGFFTLLASKLVGPDGHVFAFEPVPRNLKILHEHLRVNSVRNVTVIPLALSSAPGSARFSLGGNPSMGGLSTEGEITVEVDTFDRLIASDTVRPPAFIKMDIEGAEFDALSGGVALLRARRPALLLSAHGWRQNELCTTLLIEAGYDIQVERDGTSDGNYVLFAKHRVAGA